MRNARMVGEIARWEFARFFKVKDQVISLLLGLVIGLSFWGVRHWIEKKSDRPIRIAVLAPPSLSPVAPSGSDFRFLPPRGRDEAALRAAVGRQELDALLIRRSPDRAELVVFREPPWRDRLAWLLSVDRRRSRLAELGISPQQVSQALAPVQIAVRYHPAGQQPSSASTRILAGIVLGLMLMSIVFGSSYLFMGITGEKQLRVTEQVVAAVSPQTWIDGKILGLCGASLAALLVNGLSVFAAFTLPRILGGSAALPGSIGDPWLLLLLAAVAVPGFLFWFSFYAAVAAITDDPNSSSRPMLLFLPFLPAGLLMPLLENPNSPAFRLLSIFPLSSPVVLPVRLVLGGATAGEAALAIGLLIASTFLLRRAAGMIFELGMLLYGKEPSWSEVVRWLRRVPSPGNRQVG